MASDNYNATKEDSRAWRSDQDTRAAAKDDAATTNAAAIQAATYAKSPVDGIGASPATTSITAATGTTHTIQVNPVAKVGGATSTTQGVQVTYASSSTAKATVSATGLVTGVAAGTSTITLTAVHNTSLTTTSVITVT